MSRLDLLLVFSYALGLLYAGASLGTRLPGPRLWRISAILASAGSAILGFVWWSYPGRTLDLFGRAFGGPRDLVLTAAAIIGALAVGNLLLTRCLDVPEALVMAVRRRLGRGSEPWPWFGGLTLATSSAVLVVGLIGVIAREKREMEADTVISVVEGLVTARYPLPGGPTDLVFVDESSGYVSVDIDFFQPGERFEILHFELPQAAGGDLILETVADGLSHPRGMALLGDTLFVSDQGPLPCGGVPFQQCIGGLDSISGEPYSLRTIRGRLLAFEVHPDGSLGGPRVVLDDLPVVNFEHAVQGVEGGPEGRLYLSIGGPDQLAMNPAIYQDIDAPNLDLMGTIISLRPDGTEVEIYASGFRNVYQVTFDEQGNMFGVENDGPSARGWKFEEVLQIKRGADYGFPWEGTFDGGGVRTDGPIWTLPTVGSSGIEWAGKVGLGPGLLLGSERAVFHVALSQDDQGYHVRSRTDVTKLITLSSGNVTTLTAGPRAGQIMAGVYGYPSKLLLLDFGRATSGGMLALTCTGCHGPFLRGMLGLGPDLTPAGSLGGWTESDFITTLRTGVTPEGSVLDAQRMPWMQFSLLPEEDLVTLWRYLARQPTTNAGR